MHLHRRLCLGIILSILPAPHALAEYLRAYDFEDAAFPPFSDSASNLAINNLLPFGGGVQQAAGRVVGTSVVFTGGYLATPANFPQALGEMEALTIELWFWPTGIQYQMYLIYKAASALGMNGLPAFAIWLAPAGGTSYDLYATIEATEGASPPRIVQLTTQSFWPRLIPEATWTHVALEYDNLVTRLYINGALVETDQYAQGWGVGLPVGSLAGTVVDDPNQPLVLGAEADNTGTFQYEFISGREDDVRIFRGRNTPSACPSLPVEMSDTFAGFCIDAQPTMESHYGDSFNSCAARHATVCSLAQLYTAAYNQLIHFRTGAGPTPIGYRVSDVMFDSNFVTNYGVDRSFWGGWDPGFPVDDPLAPPFAYTGPLNSNPGGWPGPESNVENYWCCTGK